MPTCSADFSGWAGEILDCLGDTTTTVGSVVCWLETHLGQLTSALRTDFSINDSGCITGDMNQAASGIYTEMFHAYYYRKQANASLGAAGTSWISVKGEDQGEMKVASKTDIAKVYLQMSKESEEQVQKLIQWYHSTYYPQYASQILTNTRTDVSRSGMQCYPPNSYYSPNNSVWMQVG